jgi:hypothetical protein
MSLYTRVASSNPSGAKAVIKSYGYDLRTNNLPHALKQLVAAEGEPALRSIVDIHPDKEIILECYAPSKEDCGCKETEKHKDTDTHFLNAVGQVSQMTQAQKENQLTNTFLIVSAVMVLGALIIKNV